MHGYPVMQVVQYSVPPCSWPPPVDSHRSSQPTSVSPRAGIRKYVVWCLICGGLSCLLGTMFLGVYFLVRSYTSTIGYFETVPTFVPATLLMLTGLCIISLARRRNRYSYLIKLSGACGLSSALTCALSTVTTTVIHMSRLQALRECEYTRKTRTCTCYSVETHTMQDENGNLGVNDEIGGYRFVFDSADECTVVHNALYSCLRAIFGISVAGVLVAVFSCMLVYQLLSHERKKMIWEQLELRRRQAYGRQSPPGWPPLGNGPSIIGTPRNGPCRCCEQCHSHRNMMQTSYSWDSDSRFWSPPPNSAYYTQGADDLIVSRMVNQNSLQTQRPGWSWPRFPWQRTDNQRFRQTPSSPDSQYGFSTNMSRLDNSNMMQSYTLINNPHHFGIWGPPPPYSDPNSPVRRNRYLYNQCQQITEHSGVVIQPISAAPHQTNLNSIDCTQPIVSENHHSIEQICATPTHSNHRIKNRLNAFKAKDSTDSATLSDSDTQRDSTHSNTLPFRKARKKIECGAKSIGSNQSTSRVNVQNIFSSTQNMSISGRLDNGRLHENIPSCSSNFMHAKLKNVPNTGVENTGYQSMEDMLITSSAGNYSADTDQPTISNCRDIFTRSRMHFPSRDYEKLNTFTPNMPHYSSISPRNHSSSHSLPKDLTRHSICSAESEKTEYTDVSPMTPSTPYTGEDANAIALAFQREMKHQQQQQQQQQHQQQQQQQQQASRSSYKDHAEACSSNRMPMYSSRYFDSIEHKRDTSTNNIRAKNMPEIHMRSMQQQQHSNAPASNHLLSTDNGSSLDDLTASTNLYQKFERQSVYQRPTYSFASAHSTPGHSHSSGNNMKSTTTPKKRNVYATHSLGSPSTLASSSGVGDIDLVRLTKDRFTNMRKEAKGDDVNASGKDSDRKSYDHSKNTLGDSDWPDHNSDRRL